MTTDSNSNKKQFDAVSNIALGLLRKVTGLGENDLRESTAFEAIRLESLAITAFVSSLEPYFSGLSKTFIFDCRNILDVSAYLIKHHPDDARKLIAPPQASLRVSALEAMQPAEALSEQEDMEWPEIAVSPVVSENMEREAIAIVGMHGRFPGANSLDGFWENLYEGRDAITEIPSDRWSLDRFFEAGTDSRKTGLSYAKWGGFIPDVDKFDAQFFGISAREAAQMDPQERLFLECTWHAMENASLLGERAENLKDGNNYNIGVFVGLTTNTYSLLAADHWRNGGTDVPAAVPWSAANRVSFALNLSGPSLAVDTACSSSLVALHLACESIANGECKAAIAGGVNLYFHPAKYIQLCQLQMLSPTGRCHTFGKEGDGFVPGEGVGAIVLKPLSAAQADGDRILGVICGTSVNHCGRTNGYTVPNAQSQSRLIQTALDRFELPPSSVSYVEAHGTGTKLGDPIEFTALTETLAGRSSTVSCGIGSVKSNIGHLESAAGIAGIIKVLLQLRHQCITPSLGSRELNPGLEMARSRFFVPQAPIAWQPDPETGLRRAGVSSFGAGGTNGHVIIEQAPDSDRHFQAHTIAPLVFPVSARSNEQLRVLVSDLLQFIQSEEFEQPNALYSLAYVLQCGRRHHPYRFATIAKTRDELAKNLAQYIQGSSDSNALPATIFSNHIRPDEETDMQHPTQDALALARLWTQGVQVVWREMWTIAPALIDIPGYPFARERHWINSGPETMTMPANASKAIQADQSHRTFSFTGQEYFLSDHQIGGKPIFPAAAYFNCFYSVLKQHELGEQLEFQNVTWVNPFRPDGMDVASFLCDVSPGQDDFVLKFSSPDGEKVYCRVSHAHPISGAATMSDSLSAIKARCVKQLDAQACYPTFDSLGMVYGPTFRCMQSAWIGENIGEALVEVALRAPMQESDDVFMLEPGMLDGVFQSAFIFSLVANTSVEYQFIPHSVKAMRVFKKLGQRVFVHVKRLRQTELWSVFDFAVFDPSGEKVLEVDEFSLRMIPRSLEKPAVENRHRVHLFQPAWVESPLSVGPRIGYLSKTVIFDHSPEFRRALDLEEPALASSVWMVTPGQQFQIREGNIVVLNYRETDHLDLLWRMFLAEGGLPENIIFNLTGAHHDSLDVSWEAYAGLDNSKTVIEIIHSACKSVSSPRFHAQINYQYDDDEYAFDAAIAGFLRPVNLELPTVSATVVGYAQEHGNANAYFLQEFLQADQAGVQEVKWERGRRFVRYLHQERMQTGNLTTQYLPAENDVIVITGGSGAIAKSIAESLGETAGVRLALVGRSLEDASIRAFIDELRSKGVSINYWQTDCTDREKLADTLTSIRNRFGPISGILHCAGILKDAFFLRQDMADWDTVLKAKVLGALWLDELTQDDPIKWFVLCSALAGVRGNIGQSNYGLANAWLNVFAEQRHHEVAKSRRRGATMAIAWSLWNTVEGMQPPKSIVDRYAKIGLVALTKEEGIEIFHQALKHPSAVIIPIKGHAQAIEQFLDSTPEKADMKPLDGTQGIVVNLKTEAAERQQSMPQENSLESAVIAYLSRHLSKVTSTPINKIDPDVSLEAFGLDSILVMELNDLLGKDFPQISKTVLFEARNLRLLAKLLMDEHQADALKVTEKSFQLTANTLQPETTEAQASNGSAPSETGESTATSNNGKGDKIAIVGIAGRYPGASDLNELWQHLAAGHDLVSEIPGRWDMPAGKLEANPIYAKWGGFIEDFDRFDPLFFGISPRDAERMDPQERIFLQTAWHTLEDAGYTPESLSGARGQTGPRRRVGVIVGVMYGEYQLYGAGDAGGAITNSSYSSIANRVSYCLDFDGPSFAIDSMCSSSLTSISLACDQLRSGRSDAVIAGGVNLSIHPHKYRMLCELNFASTDGRCRSFGEGGDGYVPGEGVGAVLLKRLEDAERDGDYIYAVIQGSDIGHGAKTSGYTVPNADAQADVIYRAFERSGIAPSRLSYLEAHGTGTSLGDPIEIRGVTKVLAPQFGENQRCPVGSIKSNVGHLESAAGIAALSKVLLQLQHDKLVPSIHSETLNKNIDFSKTPFFVQRELADWERKDDLPRVAAISSFGAGGSNAHLVIEEYVRDTQPAMAGNDKELFLFSARNYQQLIGVVRKFIAYLDREMVPSTDSVARHVTRNKFTLTDVATTLAEGRRHFRMRLAVDAESFSELRMVLNSFVAICGSDDPKIKRGDFEALGIFYGDLDEPWGVTSHQEGAYAQAWVNGTGQARANTIAKWRKVPLPGYEFLRNRYWVASTEQAKAEHPRIAEQKPMLKSEPNVVALTPSDILARVAQGEMQHDEARHYLLAMSEGGNAVYKERVI